jgi:hypothetical protein
MTGDPGPEDAPLFPERPESGDPLLFPLVPRAGRRRIADLPPATPYPTTRPGAVDRSRPAVAPSPPSRPAPVPPQARPPEVPTTGRAAAARAAQFVGVVTGSLAPEVRRREFWGLRALTAALVLVAVAAVGRIAAGGVGSATIGALAVPVLALTALLAAGRVTAGRSGRKLTVHRLRIRRLSGEPMTCVMYGEWTGSPLRTGDIVRFSARRQRSGRYATRRADLLATPSGPAIGRTGTRAPVDVLVAQWIDRGGYALSVGLLLWTATILTR